MEDLPPAIRAMDIQSQCVARAAIARGVPVSVVHGFRAAARPVRRAWLRLEIGAQAYVYRRGVLLRARPAAEPVDGPLGRHINGPAAFVTKDKVVTKTVLAAAGVAVPAGAAFDASEPALAQLYFEALGRPACVKPKDGMKGFMVFPGLRGTAAFRQAFERAGAHFPRIIVEESVTGEVIRYFYVAPRAVAVTLNRPASVLGDGAGSIARLIAAKNRERVRRALPDHLPIAIDDDLRSHLAGQGLSLDSVPAAGERVLLRAVSNGASSADSIACADSTHPSYAAVAEAACRAIPGLVVAAVDMMAADRRRPAAPGNHWVLEVNSSPGVVLYHYPWEGESQDVSGAIVDRLIRAARPGRSTTP